MISDLFVFNKNRTGMQNNWLKVMSKLPEIKSTMGNSVSDADIALSVEAKAMLTED